MGIFSSKYKTTVGTSVTRVIEDENIPNSILSGVTKSIMNGDDQLIEYAMEEMSQSIGVRANRMYDYGHKKYPHGIPTATLMNSKSGEEIVKQTIEEDHGAITMDYYHFGPLNNLHYGWYKLQEQYGYNSVTNQFTINGRLVYLVDMIVVVKEATIDEQANGSLDQWGVSPKNGETEYRINTGTTAGFSPFQLDAETATDYLLVEYNYKNQGGLIVNSELRIPVVGINILGDFHHVRYIKSGQAKYWFYCEGDGNYPALDRLHSTEYASGGSYFPWGYFRFNKQSTVDNTSTNEYKTTKRLMDFIGLDFDSVGKSINSNPDIADVEQAMLMMAVPANSTNPICVKYLFDYFDVLYESQVTVDPTVTRSQLVQDILRKLFDKNAASSMSNNTLVIQDKKFKMTLNFRRITKAKRAGVMGKVGTHQGGYGIETEKASGFTVNGEPFDFNTDVKYHYYRRQITDTIYEEIRVEGLNMKYHIFQDYYETADENEGILLIPLDMAIVENYSIMDREILYCKALHYVFNSRIVTKIKWYQTGVFKVLMVIVAIVITIWSGGSGSGIWAAIAAGSGAALTAALISLAIQLLISFVISMAIKLFVKLVGGKFALILAIVVALYSGYMSVEAGSVAGAPMASDLLKLASNLAQTSFNDMMKDKYQNLEQEYNEFNDMVSDAKEKLEKAKAELSYNNYLTPAIIFGEKPSEFYDRTVHSGNIGVLAIDAISSYYDIALSLPKLQQTLGEE